MRNAGNQGGNAGNQNSHPDSPHFHLYSPHSHPIPHILRIPTQIPCIPLIPFLDYPLQIAKNKPWLYPYYENQLKFCHKTFWKKQPFIFTVYLMRIFFFKHLYLFNMWQWNVYTELNWLCKHMKNARSSQTAVAVLNWEKIVFSMSIVKQGGSSNGQKMDACFLCFLQQTLLQNDCLSTEKCLFVILLSLSQQKENRLL